MPLMRSDALHERECSCNAAASCGCTVVMQVWHDERAWVRLFLVNCAVQVVHSSPDCSAGALAAALAGLTLSPGHRGGMVSPGEAASAHANGATRNGHAEPAAGGRAQEHDSAAGASASGSAEAGGSQSTSVFDPLSGSRAKSG